MQESDFDDLYALEEGMWWFAGMRAITASLLDPLCPPSDRAVLDAGCGTGVMVSWLERYAGQRSVTGLDVDFTALAYCRQRGHRRLIQASAASLPLPDESIDLVTSFDVLVQLQGEGADDAAIAEMRRVLRPGGVAFVRTAAFEWMRSGHDEALGTQRRYSLPQLTAKMERGGFHVLRATYANALLLPVAIVHRLLLKRAGVVSRGSDVRPLPRGLRWANGLLRLILVLEAWLQTRISRLPFGLSAICVAERPGSGSSGAV